MTQQVGNSMYSRSIYTPVLNRDYFNTKDFKKGNSNCWRTPSVWDSYPPCWGSNSLNTLWCIFITLDNRMEWPSQHRRSINQASSLHSVLHDAIKPQRKKEWGTDVEKDQPPTCKSKTHPSTYQSDKSIYLSSANSSHQKLTCSSCRHPKSPRVLCCKQAIAQNNASGSQLQYFETSF